MPKYDCFDDLTNQTREIHAGNIGALLFKFSLDLEGRMEEKNLKIEKYKSIEIHITQID